MVAQDNGQGDQAVYMEDQDADDVGDEVGDDGQEGGDSDGQQDDDDQNEQLQDQDLIEQDGREGQPDGDEVDDEEGEDEQDDKEDGGIAGIMPTVVNAVPAQCKQLLRCKVGGSCPQSKVQRQLLLQLSQILLRYGFSLVLTLLFW